MLPRGGGENFLDKQTDRQTDGPTDRQTDSLKTCLPPWQHEASVVRERRFRTTGPSSVTSTQ